MPGSLSYFPPGILGRPPGRDVCPALLPPSPSHGGTWHESAGCCSYPAAAAPKPGDMLRIFSTAKTITM